MPYKTYGLFAPREATLRNSIRLERITINHAIYDLRIIRSQRFGDINRKTTE